MAKKEIRILFNQELVEKYREYYFKCYPKRKVFNIKATALSLNEFTAKKRMAQADAKKKYHEFCLFALEYYNIPKLKLNNCDVTILFEWKDRTRRDYENYSIVPKFYNDAITEYGLLEDDSYHQINSVITKMIYVKSKYSTVEFIFEYDDELN